MTSVHWGRRGADGWSVVGNVGKKQGAEKGNGWKTKERVEHREEKYKDKMLHMILGSL